MPTASDASELIDAAFADAAASPLYSHSRWSSWRLDGYVKSDADLVCRIYHRDPASPSGVRLAAASSDAASARAILAAHNR